MFLKIVADNIVYWGLIFTTIKELKVNNLLNSIIIN